MSHVQIRYADVPYEGKKIRLIRFLDEPQGPPAFHGEFDELPEDPNARLPEIIEREVAELFKAENLPLYFDSTKLVFSNDEVQGFPSVYFDDRDFQWQEVTLKAQYTW